MNQRYMTDDEHKRMVQIGDSFLDQLAHITADHIARMPREIEAGIIAHLRDKCSIDGTDYAALLAFYRMNYGTEKV